MTVPDRRRFPRTAAVHDHDGGIVKSRVCIRADGVREVMIDKPHLRACWPELLREFLRSALLMPHAQEAQRRIQPVEIRQGHFPRGIALQIVPEYRPRRLPAKTHFVQLLRSQLREVQTRSNGVFRKAGIVLQPADALFRHGKQHLSVSRDARRRIMHLRIVNPQRQHSSSTASEDFPWPRNIPSLHYCNFIVTRAALGGEFSPSSSKTLPSRGDRGSLPLAISAPCQQSTRAAGREFDSHS